MIGKRGNSRIYDGRQCFNAWVEMGNLQRASQLLYDQGVRSLSGDAPPPISIEISAKRWVCENPHKAREVLISAGRRLAKDDYLWGRQLTKYAHLIYAQRSAPDAFLAFCREHDLVEIAKRLGFITDSSPPASE